MIRRKMLFTVVVMALLTVSAPVWAQDVWQFNVFSADYEKFVYEVVSYGQSWDWELGEEVLLETSYLESWTLRKVGDELEITMGVTYSLPADSAQEELGFLTGIYSTPLFMGDGKWMAEYIMLNMFASGLEFEVGNSMQLFDGSRVRVVSEQTVAGVKGYLVERFVRETDEAGNRIDTVTSQWLVAPKVGWPLGVTVFDNGEATFRKILVEYERR